MAGSRPIILKTNPVQKKTNIPRMELETFFATNICELRFRRRILPAKNKKKRAAGHASYQRRMLCTSNWRYISSPIVRNLYSWKRPSKRRGPAWYRSRSLLIVWDILMNDWRMVSLDKYEILGYVSVQQLEEQMKFTEFYRQHLKNLPDGKKDHFSDI